MPKARVNEQLREDEVDELITAIVSRTRNHAGVVRGASVRGTIALKEVLQGFKEIQGRLALSSVEKAALVTLPSRISTKQGDYESAVTIVSDIVNEVLYGVRPLGEGVETITPEMISQLSPEDIMAALQNLSPAQLSQGQHLSGTDQVAIIPSEYLASTDFLQEGKEKDYSVTKKALEHLMEELEQQLRRGEITEDEYHQRKNRLKEMLDAASQLQSNISGKELAETVMEFMDAKDKRWQKGFSFQDMFVYYHVKENKLMETDEEKQLIPPKQGYYGLRVLIDYLEKREIIRTATAREKTLTLTAEALDTLLENLVSKARRGREVEGMRDYGKAQFSERTHDIRRYTIGDVFRDISVRHTLREIAKQKKNLSGINRHDFKVFMKQNRELQSDLMLCLDSSGSMGFHQKLIYARLAAAGLARAAVGNRDRVGIVTFDDFGRAILPLTGKREEIFNYIADISAGGNTNIGDGIKCATELLLREPSRNQKHIVLITDGEPTAISKKAFDQLESVKEKDMTEEYAILETRRALSNGVRTSVIHITDGKHAGEGFVRNIAKVGRGQVRRIGSMEDLITFCNNR